MKKILLLILIAAMVVTVLVACSKKTDDPSDDSSDDGTTYEAQEGIILDVNESITISVDETQKLKAINLSNGKETSNVLWSSSDIDIVAVDINGNVKGVSSGMASVTATTIDGKYSASCAVNVTSLVTSVSLDPTSLQMTVGESTKLNATIYPLNTRASNVKWSSSIESVAKVSDDGTVTALSNGSTSICVIVENKFYAFCQITVFTPITDIIINDRSIQLNKGSYTDISYSVIPIDASDQDIIWTSSNDNVAAVIDGRVTGIGTGSATLTATTSNGLTASCIVSVITPVLGVTLNYTELSMRVNDSETLIATIDPEDATNQKVTWISSAPNIVSVSEEDGAIKAKSSGVATITVITDDNSYTAECIVTVTKPVTSLSFSKSSYDVKLGETLKLSPVIQPSGADPEQFTWTSSNPEFAVVDSNGVVTGKGHGKTVITVTSKYGAKASCTINAIDPAKLLVPVTSIVNNSQQKYIILVGQNIKLKFTVLPENASDKSLTIEASNPSCVSIDGMQVTGVSEGTVTLKVKTSNPNVSLDIIVQILSLTDEEIASKIEEYKTKIKDENDRYSSAITKLDDDYNQESGDLKAMLDSLPVSSEEDYLKKKEEYERQLEIYENLKNEAEEAGNDTLVSVYSDQINSVKDNLKALESSYNTRLGIEKTLKTIEDKYTDNRSKEDTLHENNISQIEQDYQYIKPFIN